MPSAREKRVPHIFMEREREWELIAFPSHSLVPITSSSVLYASILKYNHDNCK